MTEITLNGKAHQVAPGTTIQRLICDLGIEPNQVAVERNRDVVPRGEREHVMLTDGDQVELVTFVGGG